MKKKPEPSRIEQRRKASLSRPGSKTETAREALQRERGYKIGSTLSLKFLRMMQARARRSVKAERRIDEIIAGERPGEGANEIKALTPLVMTNLDLAAFNRDVQDRFGAMRRTQTDVNLADAKPALLVVGEQGLGWPGLETQDGGKDADEAAARVVPVVPVVPASAGADGPAAVH